MKRPRRQGGAINSSREIIHQRSLARPLSARPKKAQSPDHASMHSGATRPTRDAPHELPSNQTMQPTRGCQEMGHPLPPCIVAGWMRRQSRFQSQRGEREIDTVAKSRIHTNRARNHLTVQRLTRTVTALAALERRPALAKVAPLLHEGAKGGVFLCAARSAVPF
jgi:hypothetical protein